MGQTLGTSALCLHGVVQNRVQLLTVGSFAFLPPFFPPFLPSPLAFLSPDAFFPPSFFPPFLPPFFLPMGLPVGSTHRQEGSLRASLWLGHILLSQANWKTRPRLAKCCSTNKLLHVSPCQSTNFTAAASPRQANMGATCQTNTNTATSDLKSLTTSSHLTLLLPQLPPWP